MRTNEIQPLTVQEVIKFLEAVLKHSPRYYPLFLTAIHTGLRSGELAGLKWADIDFEGKSLMVRRQMVWGQEQTTKGNRGRRVDLSTAVVSALKALRNKRREKALIRGGSVFQKLYIEGIFYFFF